MAQSVTILGSTGSIGESALRVMRHLGDEYRVYGLTCGSNLSAMARQVAEFRPRAVAVESHRVTATEEFRTIQNAYPDIEFLEGMDGVIELASRKVDISVSAIVGGAGLRPTLASIGAARRIALANKETLVMAGEIVMERAAAAGTEILPVDSEHSAIFSLLHGCNGTAERIILTASGGSLRDIPIEDLGSVSPARALAHPTWDMGDKITIDSATLMNKGLEVIEAHHLFRFDYDKIDVVIHPESIIHSMVETIDGAVYAQMSVTDMAIPILNAITYPEKKTNPFGRLDFAAIGKLTFSSWDPRRYPALDLCYDAGRRGGTMPIVLNAANEVAVRAFLDGAIPFTDIVKVVEKTMALMPASHPTSISEIFEADREARRRALSLIGSPPTIGAGGD